MDFDFQQKYDMIFVFECLFTSSHMLLDTATVFLRQLFPKLISQSLQKMGADEAGVGG